MYQQRTTDACPPAPIARVPDSIGYLVANISSLEKAIDLLEKKLQSVLGPSAPCGLSEHPCVPPGQPSLADTIFAHSNRICHCHEFINAITERLEL